MFAAILKIIFVKMVVNHIASYVRLFVNRDRVLAVTLAFLVVLLRMKLLAHLNIQMEWKHLHGLLVIHGMKRLIL
jgi:hypothetical protein